MKRFGKRCAMALVAGCLALPLSAADLPPKFDYVWQLLSYACLFGGYSCTGDTALSEFQQLGTATILMVNRIRDWMIESDKNTKALQEDVKGLKKDVAELKEAVARLQQGTPPGTPKPPDEAASPPWRPGWRSSRRSAMPCGRRSAYSTRSVRRC